MDSYRWGLEQDFQNHGQQQPQPLIAPGQKLLCTGQFLASTALKLTANITTPHPDTWVLQTFVYFTIMCPSRSQPLIWGGEYHNLIQHFTKSATTIQKRTIASFGSHGTAVAITGHNLIPSWWSALQIILAPAYRRLKTESRHFSWLLHVANRSQSKAPRSEGLVWLDHFLHNPCQTASHS